MQRSENDIGCLQGYIDRVSVGLSGGVQRISEGLQGEISCVSGGIEGCISLVCTVSRDAYLRVVPDVVCLTPDVFSGEFDIYSNVDWKIDIEDVEPEEPTIILYLTNGTMVTNDTLIKHEDVTRISLLKNNSLVHNMYYFNNQ